jgi:hypothetical protein
MRARPSGLDGRIQNSRKFFRLQGLLSPEFVVTFQIFGSNSTDSLILDTIFEK